MTSNDTTERIAAVDLGSNSFHMVLGQVVHREPVIVDRLREQVQLAAGLDEESRLTQDAEERALACLERFGQRVRHLPPSQVRAVGTNTLRVARNARKFLSAAEAALGHPIELISGREEARLIYLGVAHTLSDDYGTRLVVDIGGGSTECILGERFETIEVHSLYMGCVNYSQRFFPKGTITKEGLEEAVLAARLELSTVERKFRDIGWSGAVGSSGTIRTVEAVLRANDWTEGGITATAMRKLKKALVAADNVRDLGLAGLKTDRESVFLGGVAILEACFDSLGIERMEVSSGALREGLLYDLLGRIQHEDVRVRTIAAVQERFHVDREQALRVERTALELLRQTAQSWDLELADATRFLSWAARLHEIGMAVSYSHHHQHSAYLVVNSDMPGFSRDDQELLAAIVAAHRRKVPLEAFAALSEKRAALAARLAVLLRLSVLLNRSRAPQPAVPIELRAARDALVLSFPRSWLDEQPLTRMDIEAEERYVRPLDLKLRLEIGGT